MNKRLLYLPFISLMLFSCDSNRNVWNKSYKSTGEIVADYSLEVGNTKKSALDFLKENFGKIDWDRSGIYEYYWTEEGTPIKFSITEQSSYSNLKFAIDNAWWDDPTKLAIKNRIDKTIFIVKKTGANTGTVIFQSPNPSGEGKPSERVFDATDISEKQDGSWLQCQVHHTNVDPQTYVRSTDFLDIINVKSGLDDSLIRYTFNLTEPVHGISKFYINSYLVIQEYHTGLPDWGITIIVVSSSLIVLIAVDVYLHYRKKHHKYKNAVN